MGVILAALLLLSHDEKEQVGFEIADEIMYTYGYHENAVEISGDEQRMWIHFFCYGDEALIDPFVWNGNTLEHTGDSVYLGCPDYN